VKRVSKYRSSLLSIHREVGMLQKLAHPCVARLQDVYFDEHTVDLVFDIYRGGDMISGMHLSCSDIGGIPMAAVRNLSRQMFQSIAWLHHNRIVHRDVKADNYLLDDPDLAHPACRVYLSDFGTAVELAPNERLEERCGTQLYWAPELFAQSYCFPVDVWAAGVVAYGLVTGRFPFADEEQVHAKTVEVPLRCGDAGFSFFRGALGRIEGERLTASEALNHQFLAHKELARHEAEASLKEVSSKLEPKDIGCSDGDSVRVSVLSARCQSEATTAACSSRCDENLSQKRSGSKVDAMLLGGLTPAICAS